MPEISARLLDPALLHDRKPPSPTKSPNYPMSDRICDRFRETRTDPVVVPGLVNYSLGGADGLNVALQI
jgi:hypothetical protein